MFVVVRVIAGSTVCITSNKCPTTNQRTWADTENYSNTHNYLDIERAEVKILTSNGKGISANFLYSLRIVYLFLGFTINCPIQLKTVVFCANLM